jgi:hypothetical protein
MLEGAPASEEDKLKADGERIKLFVQQELAANPAVKYSPRTLVDQHERYSMKRDPARKVISRLQATHELIEVALPKSEIRGRRAHYLQAVFEVNESEPHTGAAEDLFAQ